MWTTQIQLDPMTEPEYQEFRTMSVAGYAAAKVEAGTWTQEESLAKSQAIFDGLLPDGTASPDNYLFTVRDVHGKQSVAVLWFALQGEPERREAYIYQIEVVEEFRGRGYGRAAMEACADKARGLGAASVGLHVFGHNKVARSLYNSLGFNETDVMMSLPLK
jgi:ribosomal protein S18 acetylase RimI-like enzyme